VTGLGLRPLQWVCLVGGALAIAGALFAFDEVSIELVVVAMGFSAIILFDAIWRGLWTGTLVFRGQAVESSSEPIPFVFLLLFYLAMLGGLIYFGVDLLASEL
jgi:hypothetical protein